MKKLIFTLIAAVTMFSQSIYASVVVQDFYGRPISTIDHGFYSPQGITIVIRNVAWTQVEIWAHNRTTGRSNFVASQNMGQATTPNGYGLTSRNIYRWPDLYNAIPGNYQIEARYPYLATKEFVNLTVR
jgi:hypothetical protein